MKIGFTCSTFDLFHAGHVAMLEEAKQQCDWLIAGIQIDPSIDRPEKKKPVQSLIERQIQVRGCKYVDETIVYGSENDLYDLLTTVPIDIRILGEEYYNKKFTGDDLHMEFYFNKRRHKFSSTELRQRVHKANGEIKV
jgi:glycerol-3-phosphate cytidylyltransferase